MSENNVPPIFLCPITGAVMTDPVQDKEGHTYERAAILEWLKHNSTSPITRNRLVPADLVPNRSLRDAIELFRGVAVGSQPTPPSPPVAATPGEVGDLTVAVCAADSTLADQSDVLVSIRPPNGVSRTPVSLVCVIDVSGSMGSAASIKTSSGTTEGYGLTILDIVKHAAKTIIASLSDEDNLALVSFSSNAKTLLNLTKMDACGKTRAKELVEDLDADGSTNLWDGLKSGLDVLKAAGTAGARHSAVLLFTDGEPTVVPPRGHLPMLQMYKKNHGLPGVVNTFGFGYKLDSELLHDLAAAGNGAYSFIPDASFVGTIFVHAVANLLTTVARSVKVTVKPTNGAVLADTQGVLGSHRATFKDGEVEVDLGTMQYDQSKDFVVRLRDVAVQGPFVRVSVQYQTFESETLRSAHGEGVAYHDTADALRFHVHRLQFVDAVWAAMKLMEQRPAEAAAGVQAVAAAIRAADPTLASCQALLQDVEGQATLALKPDFFRKWGQHYLPSLAAAHLHQYCNNFKDPGVQGYGQGTLFQETRDRIDEIFCSLPAPTPSMPSFSGGPAAPRAAAPLSMAAFNNSGNPCFAGDSLLLLADGTSKPVVRVRRGDVVQVGHPGSPTAGVATVVCVVISPCAAGVAPLVSLAAGLHITPWHPVRVAGRWVFPADLQAPVLTPCPAVYNLVLDTGHVVVVGGVECVTLGHGLAEAGVRHPFFGTRCVVDCLRSMAGWGRGEVLVDGVVRDPASGLVCGLRGLAATCHQAAWVDSPASPSALAAVP